MIPLSIIGFINNAALLMAAVLIYDVFSISNWREKTFLGQIILGIILGCIGVAIMMNPWEFLPGIIFDTRSVLLCITGFFFGAIPTLITITICGVYRFLIGGPGAWTGVAVIVSSGMIGFAWQNFRKSDVEDVSNASLYALGLVTHVVMLLWMFTLPYSTAIGILSKISIPVMLIFPLCTVLLGKLIINRLQRINSTIDLEESEDKYRHLYETMTQGVVIQDAEGKVVEANPAACKILGLSMDQLLGKTAYDSRWKLIHQDGSPYDPAEMPSNIVLQTGKPFKSAVCGVYLPGKDDYHWILISSVPRFKDGETKPFSTMTVFTDVTERNFAEKERERLLLAIEQTEDVVVITDPNGKIQYTNPAFEAVSGYTRAGILGQNPRVFKSGKQDQAFYSDLWKTIVSGKTWKGRMVNKHKDGTFYTEESTISPVKDSRGNIINYVAVKRNITENLRVIEEKDGLQDQLLQSQKMESVGRLAGGVAHDFNNMLSIIIGYSELILDNLDPGDAIYSDLTEILAAARRSSDITRQLLAFARQQTTAPKVLDLNDNIESMLKMLRRLIGEDIDLLWHPGTDLWSVKIDPSQVDQILANLCVNARDAMEGVGKLTIETRNENFDEEYCAVHAGFLPGKYVLLAVSDSGSGIAPEILNNIFEPFFTTKGLNHGTGLGLSTVYGIVKQNKGFINVYSEPGKGTTIKIYLSRHTGQIVDVRRESPQQLPLSRGETILLVEDDASILILGEKMLKKLGYFVISANLPSVAIELTKEHADDIDLLITDVVMPEMNGRELSEQLQKECSGLKTLFMSGYTANVIAHRGVLEEGIHFIAKPLSNNELAQKVREVLDYT